MNVKGLAISGRQVPNSVGVECIKTTKLYDWVILTNRDRNKVPIPKKCLALIKKCHGCDGQLNIVCQEIKKTRTCKILEEKQINIGVASAKIVTLLFSSEISISVTCTRADCECQKDCHFKVPITFIDDVILCHPEGTEIKCSIYEVYCQVLSNEILGDFVLLDVTMCKEMVVEGEAILELEGKFCGPRDPIELSADYSACAFPTFPSQCREFFPSDTCECQGDAEVINSTETILVNGGNGLSRVKER
ncbi:hypothetical protein PQ478_12575 [Alkalihalophilus pseudofirmus]|uniref:hypothetical protein n=1 Tax=Alkalihalophilus pseudofirmus TaxID=79885 RepID=UPI00259BD7A4|nr:hypothetical protein [Alkalihalophilus pseudofirmus]WEG15374.1 hypothetical protein PQ478_12575 [Alkalihalophilus pseudofirmus]